MTHITHPNAPYSFYSCEGHLRLIEDSLGMPWFFLSPSIHILARSFQPAETLVEPLLSNRTWNKATRRWIKLLQLSPKTSAENMWVTWMMLKMLQEDSQFTLPKISTDLQLGKICMEQVRRPETVHFVLCNMCIEALHSFENAPIA